MSKSTIYLGTDGSMTITGLTQQPAGTPITGATVTGVLSDASGNVVWPSVSFSSIGAGSYSYVFAASAVPPAGTYSLVVTALYSGMTLTFEHDLVVQQMTV